MPLVVVVVPTAQAKMDRDKAARIIIILVFIVQ
jgi:hypothetical protein